MAWGRDLRLWPGEETLGHGLGKRLSAWAGEETECMVWEGHCRCLVWGRGCRCKTIV